MKIINLLIVISFILVLLGCDTCCPKIKCVFQVMKIDSASLNTSLHICEKCADPIDTCVRLKRLIFQFTDSVIVEDSMKFYLTGYIGYRRKDDVYPEPLRLDVIPKDDTISKDTVIDLPFTFANVDWTRKEIKEFLSNLPGGCEKASFDYIALSPYIIEEGGKRYLSLYASAVKNHKIIFSKRLPVAPSTKNPNPRPPYPPEG